MAVYWDFRRILNVDPDSDHTCVGIAKTYGLKCKNRVGVNYRSEGSQILDQMNRMKSYSKALANLEDLADLLLCKQQHNSQKKPHLNQINEVYRKWYAVAKEEYVSLKREAERATELRATRELALMREAAQQLRDDLEREQEEMVVVEVADLNDGTTPGIFRAVPEGDPFVVSNVEAVVVRNTSDSAGPSRATQINWPVVPLHARSRKIAVFSDKQQEDRQHTPCPVEIQAHTNTTAPLTVSNGQENGSASKYGISKSNENTSLNLSFDQKANTSKSSRLASAPGLGKRVALKDKSATTTNDIVHRMNVPSASESTFAFGATTSPSPFSFEVPKQPHVGTFSNLEASSAIPSQEIEEEASPNSLASRQSTHTHFEETLEISAVTRSVSFGSAVITPPSTRYKTYLPARQQHGLMTPAETPETLVGSCKSPPPLPPPKIGDYFTNISTPTAPPPKVTRKPLPVMQSIDITDASDNREPRPALLDDAGSNDEGFGCLSRFGFSRLRRKVAANLKSLKASLSKSPR